MVVVSRIFAVLIVAQTNGFADGVADVASVIVTGSEAPDDDNCPGERDCDCPPGCPNCHSSHGVGWLPPVSARADIAELSAADIVGTPYVPSLHPVTDPRSVYRPPRTAARS